MLKKEIVVTTLVVALMKRLLQINKITRQKIGLVGAVCNRTSRGATQDRAVTNRTYGLLAYFVNPQQRL